MPKILVVDDSESVVASLEYILQGESYEVVCAFSGAQALEILKKETVDLVITDIYMPPPDGIELMRAARALRLNVPFIAMSSYASPMNMFVPARGLGARISLEKPFSRECLIEAVQATLDASLGGRFGTTNRNEFPNHEP